VRGKLKQFPEVVKCDIDIRKGRAVMEALVGFDQYGALEHAIEDAGGAAKMFHPRYLLPKAYFAMLGTPDRSQDRLDELERGFEAVPGVRSAIIDPDRWFVNEKGLQVGAAVLFADPNPRLSIELPRAAAAAGFVYESKEHGDGANDHDEWSEMNHAFAGLCLLVLTVTGVLQLALTRPPALVRYGTVIVWASLFVFLFVRADRGSWPLGPLGWWESFQEWDTAQHRLGTGMILAIAVGDYLRIRRGWKLNPLLGRWGILVIGLAGSGMLYTHLHSSMDPAHYGMVIRMNAQHVGMATSALLFALSRFAWDTWQLPRRTGPFLSLGFLGCLGLFLTLYVE